MARGQGGWLLAIGVRLFFARLDIVLLLLTGLPEYPRMCGVYASVRSCGTPLTGRGGFILAISMRVLFALLFIPKHPGPCVQTARPKVAATHVLQGWAIEGDVSSPSSQFALFSAEDRTAMNRRWFDARFVGAPLDVLSKLFFGCVILKVADIHSGFPLRRLRFGDERPQVIIVV